MDISDSAGYCCAFVGALAHGSYGVPVKATKDVDVHPLILQSYKTLVLAFMSCVVIPVLTMTLASSSYTPIRFTPLGILSGFLWVSGGACGIYGIRQAGMAIAVGTWASLMVCVNFTFGILIFREPVYSFVESCMAFGLLLVGLVGMSKYSAKVASSTSDNIKTTENGDDTEVSQREDGTASSAWDISERSNPSGSNKTSTRRLPNRGGNQDTNRDMEDDVDHDDHRHKKFSYTNLNLVAIWYRILALVPSAFASLTPRQAGICMAAMNGIFGGCALVPLHYAKKQGFAGLTYIPSFGLGSFISNIGLWSLYFCWTYYQQKQLVQQQQIAQQEDKELQATSTTANSIWKSSMDLMPSFYWSKLWKRGLFAGFLLSIGMICSILATGALGQGVGNSLVQLKILISGLWGIFYYKEIKNKRSIRLWFLSACICVSGILGLSYQRLMATQVDATAATAAAVVGGALPQVSAVTAAPILDAVTDAPQNVQLATPIQDLPQTQ